MASTLQQIDTQHEDMIHDVQMDYYGKRMATCSSDRLIKIFEIGENDTQTPVAEIKGHEGPVWEVAWAHPKFGSILASCSYDRKVYIWKETSKNVWVKIFEYEHESSVNSIDWAPHEVGLVLACGSSDSYISVLTHTGDKWEHVKFHAHSIGVNSVSWAPAFHPSVGSAPSNPVKKLVSGGCDNLVKIWKFEEGWKEENSLEGHSDWVRDVAWAPNIGLPVSTIASCSQDGNVLIWQNSGSGWKSTLLNKFNDVVWSVSWSITGNILAVSGGDNKVTLWKETLDSGWTCLSTLEDNQN